MSRLDKNAINNIKNLALDFAYSVKRERIDSIISASEIFYALYAEELNFKRNVPKWINRDRFILASDNTELLYSTLFMSGFNIAPEELKTFGELNSNLPRVLNKDTEYGVDVSFSNAHNVGVGVGIALGERLFETIINRIKPKSKLINFNTYIMCDVPTLNTGRAMEALLYAAEQKLNKLIVICENKGYNKEELVSRFEAINYNVINTKGDFERVCDAIDSCKKSKLPSIIFVEVLKEDKLLTHDTYIELKNDMKCSLEPFNYDEATRSSLVNNIDDRLNKNYQKWLVEYENARNLNNARLNEVLDLLEKDILNIDFDDSMFKINENYFEELSLSNEKMINIIASKSNYFLGIGFNTSKDDKTYITKASLNNKDDHLGQNINLDSSISIAGDIANGLALLNLRPFVGIRARDVLDSIASMKMTAAMNIPVIYVVSQDSGLIKNDGELSPVMELNILRETPNLIVIRPADINEVIGSWDFAIDNNWPVVITCNDKKVVKYRNTNAKYVKYGAYMIRKERLHLDGILIASGSDVAMAMDVAEELFNDGIDMRVVSMPSIELFLKQNPRYEEQLLPKECKTFVLDSSEMLMWNRFASNSNCIFALHNYLKSGNTEDAVKELGLDKDSIVRKIKENL